MPSLKDMRNRIGSVKATRKITKAMQMVAAAKLRRAQEAATAARPYAERMDRVLANLNKRVTSRQGASPLLVGTGKDEVHLLVVMTAERGLCGGFNSNIARLARADAQRLARDGKTVKMLCVGRKGYDQLRRDCGRQIVERVDLKGVKQLGFANAARDRRASARHVRGRRVRRRHALFLRVQVGDRAEADRPAADPRQAARRDGSRRGAAAAGASTSSSPTRRRSSSYLLPRNIAAQIFRGLLENAACEQGARMSAMDNATRNAGDMINKLTMRYNRQRQANITKELIEIISGAEAL